MRVQVLRSMQTCLLYSEVCERAGGLAVAAWRGGYYTDRGRARTYSARVSRSSG